MRRTVHENIIPIGSKIMWKIIGVDEIDIMLHSRRSVFDVHTIMTVNGRMVNRINHIILLAMLDK